MTQQIQYVDPVNGIDGTGTLGVDWVGNPGNDPLRPRKTADTAAGMGAGMSILFKRGTVYPLTGSITRINGNVVNYGTDGLRPGGGTTSTLKKDRIHFGAYGDKRLGRPVLDGLGQRTTGVSFTASGSTFLGGCTMTDIEVRNCLTHGVYISANNITVTRCKVHRIGRLDGTDNNDSDGITVTTSATNVSIDRNLLVDIAADHVLCDSQNVSGLTIQNNAFMRIGELSRDGADAMVVIGQGDAVVMRNNLAWKVSNQKNFAFIERKASDTATITTTPVIEDNCFVGVGGGSGAMTMLSVAGYTFRRNVVIAPRGLGHDRSGTGGTGRYSEGGMVYGNVFWGIPWVYRPDGTYDADGLGEFDSAGYANRGVFGGSTNASAHVESQFTNNFAYNFQQLVRASFNTGFTVAHNNVCVRMKQGAMAGLTTSAAASGNILFDDGEAFDAGGMGAVGGGSPVSNIYHDSNSTNPVPQSVRRAGSFPGIDGRFAIIPGVLGYQYGDGTKVGSITDRFGTAFSVDTNRCNVGPVEVA